MAFRGLTLLAVVPARGGSKGIAGKNLRTVSGLSLVARAASVVAELAFVDLAVISTDDAAIRAEAVAHGLEAPFERPAELATDFARSREVWRHAWLECERLQGRRFDLSILLEPTSPLRRADDVTRTLEALLASGAPAAATVSPTSAHYTPHKALMISPGTGLLRRYHDDADAHALRQSIPDFYHRNGLCYAVTRGHLVDDHQVLDERTTPVVVERPTVNIDEPFDLELAQWLYEREIGGASDVEA